DAHTAEDKTKREEIEARNQLDGMVYNLEKMLREQGDKISGAEKTEVESALADAKKALEGSDKDAMNAAREKLTAASHKLAEVMYKSQAQSGGAAPGAGPQSGPQPGGDGSAHAGNGQKKEGEVIDAEYVDVDEKK